MQTTTQSSLTPEQIASLAEFDREAEEAAKIIKEYRASKPFIERYKKFLATRSQYDQFITVAKRDY